MIALFLVRGVISGSAPKDKSISPEHILKFGLGRLIPYILSNNETETY